jgi:hypothetical protein
MSGVMGFYDVSGIEGYDLIGDDIEGDDIEVGYVIGRDGKLRRRARKARRRGRAEGRLGQAPAVKEMALQQQNYGAPMTYGTSLVTSAQRIGMFGLGSATLTTAAPTASLQATAQHPVQGMGLVLSAFGDADLDQVQVNDIKVGTVSQLQSLEALPGIGFRYDATLSNMVLAPLGAGVTFFVSLTALGLGTNETVTVLGMLRSVGAHQ